jgi:hypothetical protein
VHDRCACAGQDIPVLGACLGTREADTFCGTGAQAFADSCAFLPCTDGDVIDLVTGKCTPRAFVRGTLSCSPAAEPVVESGHAACIAAEDACPRGTTMSDRDRRACAGPPRCPPGTIAGAEASAGHLRPACWPVVASTPRGPIVDLGVWTTSSIGLDGGRGADWLCRPLAQRPGAFGVAAGQSVEVLVQVALSVPDQDVSRARAVSEARDAASGLALSSAANEVVQTGVDTLVTALRGLGGEANAAAASVAVRCTVRSL